MSVAVIEYEYKGYGMPNDSRAWDIQASVSQFEGVVLATTSGLLADLRRLAEEAGLERVGDAAPIRKHNGGRWDPRWREVWRSPETAPMAEASPRAEKAQRESGSRTRTYWQRANAKRARLMKPHEARLARLATAAEAKYPELAGRATRAAELVRAGHVAPQGGARFSVHSQEGSEIYLVHTERRTCTCTDYKRRQAPIINGAPMCKHRAAALMWLKVQAPDPARIHRERQQLENRVAAVNAGVLLA